MSDPSAQPLSRIVCQWCQTQNEPTAVACRSCGAPLDIKDLVSESGWREAPRIKDMTEIQFGTQHLPGGGRDRARRRDQPRRGRSVFFEHHVMLWKDDAVRMSVMPLAGGIKRALAGMPFIISVAHGPGRIAFSRDATGELVVLPLHPGMELDVREHAFLLASHHDRLLLSCASRGCATSCSAARGCSWTASSPPARPGCSSCTATATSSSGA